MRQVNKELVQVHRSELVGFPGNPRHNTKSAKMVAKSIENYGYINPIIVCPISESGLVPEDWKKKKDRPTTETKYVILAGNTRFKALTLLEEDEFDVLVVRGLTPEQIRGFVIADNRAGEYSLWNYTALDRMVTSIDKDQKDALGEFSITSAQDNKDALENLIRTQVDKEHHPSSL